MFDGAPSTVTTTFTSQAVLEESDEKINTLMVQRCCRLRLAQYLFILAETSSRSSGPIDLRPRLRFCSIGGESVTNGAPRNCSKQAMVHFILSMSACNCSISLSTPMRKGGIVTECADAGNLFGDRSIVFGDDSIVQFV